MGDWPEDKLALFVTARQWTDDIRQPSDIVNGNVCKGNKKYQLAWHDYATNGLISILIISFLPQKLSGPWSSELAILEVGSTSYKLMKSETLVLFCSKRKWYEVLVCRQQKRSGNMIRLREWKSWCCWHFWGSAMTHNWVRAEQQVDLSFRKAFLERFSILLSSVEKRQVMLLIGVYMWVGHVMLWQRFERWLRCFRHVACQNVNNNDKLRLEPPHHISRRTPTIPPLSHHTSDFT